LARAGEQKVALRVDRAADVIQVPPDAIDGIHRIASNEGFFAGVARLVDGLVLIHDLSRFLSNAETTALESAMSQPQTREASDEGAGVDQSRPAAVAEIARVASGLAFGPARRAEAEHRIRQAMQRARMTDLARYRALVETDEDARDELVAELSVGETYFFRDPQHFQFVRDTVLPELRRRRGSQHVVRAWSAGRSTGEEAYSLAILLEEEGCSVRTNQGFWQRTSPAVPCNGRRRLRHLGPARDR